MSKDVELHTGNVLFLLINSRLPSLIQEEFPVTDEGK